jgi:sulfite oxidase
MSKKQTTLNLGRREFISRSGLAAFAAMLGTDIVFGSVMPRGLVPELIQNPVQEFPLPGKHPDLILLNDKPWNIETPVHLLDDKITPADKMYVRNNGNAPENTDTSKWTLTIEGESVIKPLTISLKDLRTRYKPYTYQLVLECGGNGRAEFSPTTKGNQFTHGAVSCAKWTGVRLKDILQEAGIKSDAVYIGYYGKDTHLSGSFDKTVISRGVPIRKAMEDETLIAWQMNGKDIPLQHGFPLRLVVGGWPASVSGKWLHKIVVRNKVHDGEKMESPSYRVPCDPVAPGEKVSADKMCIIESMPVKSIITYPKTGGILKNRNTLEIRGHAWSGDKKINKVEYSIDFGNNWHAANVDAPVNLNAWQHWTAAVSFPKKGYYEIWARATDSAGATQPMVVPGWNPKGYLNNASHRIAIKVEV